ncbi:hypothetical protein SB717_34815, partial [Priestia sp. SIMBA_032]|uniref:hypothetical protein n=1 Tax=Priestia sp. SIMBA_032 TaxID=3085775 RepID=UPI00397E8CA5
PTVQQQLMSSAPLSAGGGHRGFHDTFSCQTDYLPTNGAFVQMADLNSMSDHRSERETGHS